MALCARFRGNFLAASGPSEERHPGSASAHAREKSALVAPRPLDDEIIFTVRPREVDDRVEASNLDTDLSMCRCGRVYQVVGALEERSTCWIASCRVEQGEAQTVAEQRLVERRAMWPRVVLRIREQMSDFGLTVDDIGFHPVRERRVLTKAEQDQPHRATPHLG